MTTAAPGHPRLEGILDDAVEPSVSTRRRTGAASARGANREQSAVRGICVLRKGYRRHHNRRRGGCGFRACQGTDSPPPLLPGSTHAGARGLRHCTRAATIGDRSRVCTVPCSEGPNDRMRRSNGSAVRTRCPGQTCTGLRDESSPCFCYTTGPLEHPIARRGIEPLSPA